MADIRLSPSQWESLRGALAHAIEKKQTITLVYRANHQYFEKIAERMSYWLEDRYVEQPDVLEDLRKKANSALISASRLRKLFYLTWKDKDQAISYREESLRALCMYAYDDFSFLHNSPISFPDSDPYDWDSSFPISPIIEDSYVANVERELEYKRLRILFKQAQKRIFILETFIENWVNYSDEIRQAAEAGCRVDILVARPDSSILEHRFMGLNRSGDPQEQIISLLRQIKSYIDGWEVDKDDVNVQLYDQLPGMSIYGADDTAYCGWYWLEKLTMNGPYLKLSRSNPLYDVVIDHFDKLKDRAIEASDFQPVFQKQHFGPIDRYIGQWCLYCHKHKKGRVSYYLDGMEQGDISRNTLIIHEEKVNIYSHKCTFHDSDGHTYTGRVKAQTRSFLAFELKANKSERWLSFLVHKGSGLKDHLIGIFNSIYEGEPILATGVLAMCREEEPLPMPTVVDPFDNRVKQKIDDALIRYLIFTLNSRIEPLQDIDALKRVEKFGKSCQYQGVYRIFSYYKERGNSERHLLEGIMYISKHYTVEHKRVHPHDPNLIITSYGKAEMMKEGPLLIRLKNPYSGRIGSFMMSIQNKKPASEKTIYSGIFTGFSRPLNYTIANRTAFYFLGQDKNLYEEVKPDLHPFHSPSYNDIPEGIRKALSGRIPNLIGFFHRNPIFENSDLMREAEGQVNMGKLFFDSAALSAMKGDMRESEKMIRRMLEHGYRGLKDLYEQLDQWIESGWMDQTVKQKLMERFPLSD